MSISTMPFGKTEEGKEATLFIMTAKDGSSISLTDYGAHLVSVKVPDKNGQLGEVCLGFDDVSGYEKEGGFLGASLGRFGNRIGNGTFTLNGIEYTLYKNDGGNTLHGGKKGFDKKFFTAEPIESMSEDTVIFNYVSPDMEEGFPGEMQLQISFSWGANHCLSIRYMASSDKDTVINVTNHAYWNLSGAENVLDPVLKVHSGRTTQVDLGLIPTGKILPLDGTLLDLREGRTIREILDRAAENAYVTAMKGLDFNFIVDGDGMREAAVLSAPDSGRVLRIWTTEPAIQVYSGQGLNQTGHGGTFYGPRAGIALETQHYPDSPNHPEFPDTTLKAGETFVSQTQYRFTV